MTVSYESTSNTFTSKSSRSSPQPNYPESSNDEAISTSLGCLKVRHSTQES